MMGGYTEINNRAQLPTMQTTQRRPGAGEEKLHQLNANDMEQDAHGSKLQNAQKHNNATKGA